MRNRYFLCTFIMSIAVITYIIGCGSNNSSAPLAPFSPEIFNTQDNFQFQVTDAQNVSTTVQYNW